MTHLRRQTLIAACIVAVTLGAATAAAQSTAGSGAVCKVGQKCVNDGTVYRVTKATVSTTVTGNHGKTATTTQAFVTVRIALYNTRLAQHDVVATDIVLRGSNGKSYGPSKKGGELDGDGKPQPTFFPAGNAQYMGPHHKAVVVMLYELPRAAAHGATLLVGSASPKAVVALGL